MMYFVKFDVMKNIILVISVCFILVSCAKKEKPYSFFVAGHLYGKPGTSDLGAYTNFKEKFDFIKSHNDLRFGVMTGDVVKEGKEAEWKALVSDMNDLSVISHLARGNHDYKNEENLTKYFPKKYYSFKEGADLHIILDANIDGWNITGEQLIFLRNVLEREKELAKNIFLYSHQVIWFNLADQPRYLHVNSEYGRHPKSNFYSEILPLFDDLDAEVYFFAGDVGAGSWASDISYTKPSSQIHLIASGMGDGVNDSFIMVTMNAHSHPEFSVISVDSTNKNQVQNLDHFLK